VSGHTGKDVGGKSYDTPSARRRVDKARHPHKKADKSQHWKSDSEFSSQVGHRLAIPASRDRALFI